MKLNRENMDKLAAPITASIVTLIWVFLLFEPYSWKLSVYSIGFYYIFISSIIAYSIYDILNEPGRRLFSVSALVGSAGAFAGTFMANIMIWISCSYPFVISVGYGFYFISIVILFLFTYYIGKWGKYLEKREMSRKKSFAVASLVLLFVFLPFFMVFLSFFLADVCEIFLLFVLLFVILIYYLQNTHK